ncbi:hypothetical protein ACKKBG_A22090 [Auxenochlorella protothecoides x Auxenochlorella symbiontica]|uniref:Stationary phase protein 4 n=1 Tax=Auxenochlorella protothecoides TaxID=3075 RepID=A0A1D2A784_AUXPR
MSILESLKRLSGRGDTKTDAGTPVSPTTATSPRTNTWQDVFNPGRNYNRKGSYFDNVGSGEGDKNGTIWEQHLQSKGSQEIPAPPPAAAPPGMSNEELRKMFSSERVDQVLKQNEGKSLDFNSFVKQLQGNPGDKK